MSRTMILTLDRPQQRLGISVPFARRVNAGHRHWPVVLFFLALALCVGTYVYQVNRSAEKGYAVRDLEKRIEASQTTVADLESRVENLASLEQVKARLPKNGYEAVDRFEYLNPEAGAYALAK